MKKLALLALLVPLCLTVPSSAGTRSLGSVGIDQTGRRAYGNIGGTYNSSSINEKIECQLTAYATHTNIWCTARTATGVTGACSYTNAPAGMIAAVGAIKDDSNLHFTWTTTGQCGYIHVTNGSTTETKTPPASNQMVFQ